MNPDFETEQLILKVVLGGFLLLAVAALYRVLEWLRALHRQIEALGEQLGLQVHRPPRFWGLIPRMPELTGTWQGWSVQIDGGDRGSRGWSRPFATLGMGRVEASLWQLRVRPRVVGGGLDRSGGLAEIRTDDPAFDRAWVVESNRPGFTQAMLTAERRQALRAVGGSFPRGEFFVSDGEFTYIDEGALHDPVCRERLSRAVPVGAQLLEAAMAQAELRDEGVNLE